jgi:hypothetical protein
MLPISCACQYDFSTTPHTSIKIKKSYSTVSVVQVKHRQQPVVRGKRHVDSSSFDGHREDA